LRTGAVRHGDFVRRRFAIITNRDRTITLNRDRNAIIINRVRKVDANRGRAPR